MAYMTPAQHAQYQRDRLEQLRIIEAIHNAIPVGAAYSNVVLALTEVLSSAVNQWMRDESEGKTEDTQERE